ncbi:MAG: FMN-binding protein [Oscillospiraceae bacterium]|nr:FMN-binding protein [Oscillospiraceae bacterium]
MENLKQQWKSILGTTAFLLAVCAVVTLAVAGTYVGTADRIAEQERIMLAASMGRLIEADQYDVVLYDAMGAPKVYRATMDDGTVRGHLILTGGRGYGGTVYVMTGITDGVVVGVEIINAAGETPGLGLNIQDASFRAQFAGVDGSPELIRSGVAGHNQIQSLAGATVSVYAVVLAVRDALVVYAELS